MSAYHAKPFVKWAGGKARLLRQFEPYFPSPAQFGRYIEPFAGGGAVFFHLWNTRRLPDQAFLFDTNAELINAYRGNLGGDCSSGSVPLRALSPHHVYYGVFENGEQQRGYMTVYEAWAEVWDEPARRIPVLCLETINVPMRIFNAVQQDLLLIFEAIAWSRGLVGGLVLTLMTLPTIIIASRSALKAVPPSIREAALGVGASRMQMVVHHVLPLALPGMLTGTIIGMARALGETAPLLMIGMVAFIVDIPQGLTDPSTVLPVQVYLWADSPERAFLERTSGAILVLLGFLLVMNATAVILRQKFERRW